MSWLKIYDWEHKQWPRENRTRVRYEFRDEIAYKLAAAFGVTRHTVSLDRRGDDLGQFLPMDNRIRLPNYRHECSLGIIYHEVSHALNYQQTGNRGHQKTFKKTLIKVYVEAPQHLPRIIAEIIAKRKRAQARWGCRAAAQTRAAERRVALKTYRKSREGKMTRLEQRLRKLDTRIKRLTTIRKSAARSLAAYQRSERKAKEKAFEEIAAARQQEAELDLP